MKKGKAKEMIKSKTGQVIEERQKEFKKYGVQPVGCLKNNIGCRKTNHLAFDLEEKKVRCNFDKKKGCISPFPRKEKPVKEKKSPKKEEKKPQKEPPKIEKKKAKRAKKIKFTQVELEVNAAKEKVKAKEKATDEKHIHHKKKKKHTAKGL